MGNFVETVIEDDRWQALGLEAMAERACAAVVAHQGLTEDTEISLLGANDARIALLNGQYRSKHAATNVLSWPAEELGPETPGATPEPPTADFPGEPIFLGDIALAFETCEKEALAAQKPLQDHVTHLIVHGVLHLLGYDHVQNEDADLMERLEVVILGKLGLPDPY